jgi:predicted Zn finger-like uncharacterized protein
MAAGPMRCKSCDYPLWNLADRTCPECGATFRPSEHEFVAGNVVFRCPHCSQHYYGTSSRGHLEPKRFVCRGCNRPVDMDEMIVAPREGVEVEQTDPDRMPWLHRGNKGPVRSWFATMKWAMVEPQRLIRATPVTTSIFAAWLFSVVTTTIFFSVGILLPQMIYHAVVSFGPVGGGMGAFMFSLGGPAGYAAALVIIAVYLIIWAASAHGILRLTGETPGGLARTCHSIFYASSAGPLAMLPCMGWLFGATWWIVSATNMVKESQRAHGGRAALAVLLWPSLSILLWVALYVAATIFLAVGAMTAGGRGAFVMAGPAGGAPSAVTQFIGQSVVSSSVQPGATNLEHVALLLVNGQWNRWLGDFCQPGTKTTIADIPVGSITLADALAMGFIDKIGAAKAATDALPADVVAYRFGDFVLTYHGANLGTMDPRLWVVVMTPDPDVNGAPAATDQIYICTANHRVITTTAAQLPSLIQQQNQYRSSLGLPPLPDLTTVTHDRPATAPSNDTE